MPPLVDHAADRLTSLSEVLALDTDRIVSTFRDLVGPWSDLAPTSWRSEISDDHTPIELSVTLDEDDVALRVLFEVQAKEPTLDAFRSATLAFHARLESEFGADLSNLRRVEELFLPKAMQGTFAAWSSVVFARNEPPTFKTYLNPQAQGPARASALVEEALARVGLRHAWAHLSAAATRRGPHLDEIKYFALDLTRGPHARVKVYVHHHAASAADLDAACARSRDHASDDMLAFVRTMRGGDEPMTARAPFTCHAFSGEPGPATTTIYVPVCAYAATDADVERRAVSYLEGRAIDPARYRRILGAAARRSLEAGVGLQSWIALRRRGARARLTIYLATEAQRVHPPGSVPAPSADRRAFASPDAVIARVWELSVDEHPFVRRVLRDPRGAAVWSLMHALREGMSRPAVGPANAAMRLIEALDASRASPPSQAALAAGRRLRELLPVRSSNTDDALGALADSMAERLVRTMARVLPDLPTIERASAPNVLPRGADAIASFARDALDLHRAFWNLLDDLYDAEFAELA
jgi:DMATS type aromatic prenyltransferase